MRKKERRIEMPLPATIGQKELLQWLKKYEEVIFQQRSNNESPYLKTIVVQEERRYNPNYGDERTCVCGHAYDRHFDPFENNDPVGCKYCQCRDFQEKPPADQNKGLCIERIHHDNDSETFIWGEERQVESYMQEHFPEGKPSSFHRRDFFSTRSELKQMLKMYCEGTANVEVIPV